MKQLILDKWVKPILNNPRTTIAGIAALIAIFLPKYGPQISAAAAGLGLFMTGDAKKGE